MLNIVIVSYYYEPYNIIASARISSFSKYLSQRNNVTVITRSWSGTENGMKDIMQDNADHSVQQVTDNLKIIRLPFFAVVKKKGTYNYLVEKYNYYFGEFTDIPGIKENFEKPLTSYLREHRETDCIIYSCNPYQFIPMAATLYKSLNIPFIIDFRDYISSAFLKREITFKQRLYKNIIGLRLLKQLKNASALITVSKPIQKQLQKVFSGPIKVIYNGFEEAIMNDVKAVSQNGEFFQITYTGNINPEMNIDVFMTGLKNFCLNAKVKPMLKAYFIGLSEEAKKRVQEYSQNVDIVFLPWMPHKEVIRIAKSSSLLVYMGWQGYSGVFSGKIFDYLGLQRKIILAPGDNDVIERLILETNSGYVASHAKEVTNILSGLYNEWHTNRFVKFEDNWEKISVYSRKSQANKLEAFIKSAFK